jgi:hypothetical protein
MNRTDSTSRPASLSWLPLSESVRTLCKGLVVLCAMLAAFGATHPGCQTSFTPKPKCSPGWHVEHAPSHQGHVWDCVANDGSGRVPG